MDRIIGWIMELYKGVGPTLGLESLKSTKERGWRIKYMELAYGARIGLSGS